VARAAFLCNRARKTANWRFGSTYQSAASIEIAAHNSAVYFAYASLRLFLLLSSSSPYFHHSSPIVFSALCRIPACMPAFMPPLFSVCTFSVTFCIIVTLYVPISCNQVTYMDFSGRRGMLADQLAELRNSNIPGTLSRIKVFSSLDGRLGFNIFSFDQVRELEN